MKKSIFDINDTLPEPKFVIQAKENDEGEDEGLKAIREHEDCTDISPELKRAKFNHDMELKTLKEIEGKISAKATIESTSEGVPLMIYNGSKCSEVLDGLWVEREKLKQEAIKWIKTGFYDMPMFKNHCNDDDWAREIDVKNWIMYFFNITAEDLK